MGRGKEVVARIGRPDRSTIAMREKVINLSWEFLIRCLEDPKFPKKQKADIATKICVKAIPQEVESNSNVYLKIVDELTNSDPTTIRGIIESLRKSVSEGRSIQLN